MACLVEFFDFCQVPFPATSREEAKRALLAAGRQVLARKLKEGFTVVDLSGVYTFSRKDDYWLSITRCVLNRYEDGGALPDYDLVWSERKRIPFLFSAA